MIPNLSNAASSNSNLYIKKKKKKEEEANKFKGNRYNIPNLSNAAKSNKDTYKPNVNNKSNKSSNKGKKLTGKERAQALAKKRIGKGTAKNPDTTIAQLKERNTKRIKKNASKKNADFKKMRSGDMSKAAFIKKYPNSQTAKKNGVTTKRTVNKKVVNNKNNKKTYKKLNDRQFNKKFDVKKGDSKLKKFTKSGGLSGLINRRLKILKNMKKKDFLLNKKK